jgi:hypothetical protein
MGGDDGTGAVHADYRAAAAVQAQHGQADDSPPEQLRHHGQDEYRRDQ